MSWERVFGRALREAREARGMTRAGLAEAVRERTGRKCSPQQIEGWESGRYEPHGGRIADLAAALGVSVAVLYGEARPAA